jgi:hypothetical protein
MAHELSMGDDGILRLALIGDQDEESMKAFLKDFMPFLEATTEREPLRLLADSSRDGKYTAGARKSYLDLNRDPRVGKAAIVGANRYIRVLAGFVLKASRRDNIRFSDTEKEALAWLKEGA